MGRKERRHVLDESFKEMVPTELGQDGFRDIFAHQAVYSGKFIVIISQMDMNKIVRNDEDQKCAIHPSDIKAGMSCFMRCTGMELYTGQEDSYGHQADDIIQAVYDGEDLIIETDGMIYSTMDFTKEFVQAAHEVAERMGLETRQLVPAIEQLERIVAEAERTGPTWSDDD